MVGLVIVSHSSRLAEGVAELAREMAGPEARIATAGGLEGPDSPLGTDATRVMQAIERVYSDAGVVVLMDLGSAVLNAELALDLLPPEYRERVVLCGAPLVEGAVAAAAQARGGATLEQVAAEARGALRAKQEQLVEPAPRPTPPARTTSGPELTLRLTVPNALGLHVRPAARLAQTAMRFTGDLRLRNLTTHSEAVEARSINSVMMLGVRQGHEVEFIATGPEATSALEALRQLAAINFGDEPAAPRPPVPQRSSPPAQEDSSPWLTGIPAAPGIAIGPAVLLHPPAEERDTGAAASPQEEWTRLQRALATVRKELTAMRASVALRSGSQTAGIFEGHLLLLGDDVLLRAAHEALHARARSALSAWNGAVEAMALRYEAQEDELLRSRAADVRDVGRQVSAVLGGAAPLAGNLALSGILIARDFAPSDVARLDARSVQGLCAARGAATSHAAILARSLGIAAVFGLGDAILQVSEGTPLIVDATAGRVCPRPEEELLAQYQQRVKEEERSRKAALELRAQPALTRDGRQVEVAANISNAAEARSAVEAGAEGVGLFRTEFLFLGRPAAPDEDEQYQAYRDAAEALEGRSLIIRTLDIGGDKPLPYLGMRSEANPFLGLRGLRFCLAHRELFSIQLRAIARAAAEHPIRVMFPMVTTLEEWREARALWNEAARAFPEAARTEVGLMLEVPSAALLAPHLAEEASFFSLGTNDLTQYLFAAERGNASVAHLADALHPALLQTVARVVEAAHARGRWVGICGELAGDVLATPLLVGLGVDELSMSAPAIAAVKQALRTCHAAEARTLAQQALACPSAAEVRRLLGP
ncbi:phosphoenolpyruvate--protein phosphotransferase [Hyalangium versicolor]|uniref:phosphoenolpyruvate--protein phosphotransferase n=1 Tax=Hyalangium versicolor TaxID=2861190 RepID=UPI001CCCFFC6|nr:phosphoenolpyruvate--protein phosphotransferase [Hyalangium versicolor]